jgi:hypothetical protein
MKSLSTGMIGVRPAIVPEVARSRPRAFFPNLAIAASQFCNRS